MSDDDPIKAIFSSESEYIEDDGFADSVMCSLPKRRNLTWLKIIPILIVGLFLFIFSVVFGLNMGQLEVYLNMTMIEYYSVAIALAVLAISLIWFLIIEE